MIFGGNISRREALKRITPAVGTFAFLSGQNRGLPAGSPVPTTTDNLNIEVYGRQPLFFTNNLLNGIQPTIESSLYYPLDIKMLNLDVAVSAAGLNRTDPFGPDDSHHWLVTHMNVSAGENGLGKFSNLFYDFSGGTIGAQRVTLQNVELSDFVAGVVAVIGSSGYEVTNDANNVPHQIQSVGIRPIYVKHPIVLIHQFNNLDGGNGITRRIAYLELPASQPFGPLMGAI